MTNKSRPWKINDKVMDEELQKCPSLLTGYKFYKINEKGLPNFQKK